VVKCTTHCVFQNEFYEKNGVLKIFYFCFLLYGVMKLGLVTNYNMLFSLLERNFVKTWQFRGGEVMWPLSGSSPLWRKVIKYIQCVWYGIYSTITQWGFHYIHSLPVYIMWEKWMQSFLQMGVKIRNILPWLTTANLKTNNYKERLGKKNPWTFQMAIL